MSAIIIFQLYRSAYRIPKSDYTPELRTWIQKPAEPFLSRSGYLLEDRLHLPNHFSRVESVQTAGIIVLVDQLIPGNNTESNAILAQQAKQCRMPTEKELIHLLRRENLINRFELFKLAKEEDGHFHLSLNYKEMASMIGLPEREDHQIAQLKKGDILRFRINGLTDFTMTGRLQRTYAEFEFLLHYVGQATSIQFGAPNQIEYLKTPPQATEEVDERKHFY